MRRTALQTLGCPHCNGPLEPDVADGESVENGRLTCLRQDLEFPVVDGVPYLVRLDRAAPVARYASEYSAAWRRNGWGVVGSSFLLGLPWRDTTRRQSTKWKVKARSMVALFSILDELKPRKVVDLGAGFGWLAHHLALRGYEVYAVDVARDADIGLRAADAYLRAGPFFERVWGELEHPPFQSNSVDLVVCNASLHYARSLREATGEIRRILRASGSLVVMNSPVHADEGSANRAQREFRAHLRELGASDGVALAYHHFIRSNLEAVLQTEVGPVAEAGFEPGRLFRVARKLKGVFLGMELASFPILIARKGDR